MTTEIASEQPPVRPSVAHAAARWLTTLLLDGLDARQTEACRRWREADPEHERAWQRAATLQASLQRMPPALVHDTLRRHADTAKAAQAQRRQTLRLVAGLLLAPPAAWMAWQWSAAPSADRLATGTGERRDATLPDGSRLWLNARTELRLAYGPHERRIELAQGELLVHTAPDPQRSFLVQTRSGLLRALGTRFLVRDLAGAAGPAVHLAVHEGAVEWTDAAGRRTVVAAGQALDLAGDAPATRRSDAETDTAWARGILVARDLPLPEFAARLAVHRSGWLRCDPALQVLRISGVFQLDQTDAVLDALPRTLPVRVVWRTHWWASIEPAHAQGA